MDARRARPADRLHLGRQRQRGHQARAGRRQRPKAQDDQPVVDGPAGPRADLPDRRGRSRADLRHRGRATARPRLCRRDAAGAERDPDRRHSLAIARHDQHLRFRRPAALDRRAACPAPTTPPSTATTSYGRRTWEIGPKGANGLRIATRTEYRLSDDRPIYSERGTLPNETSTALTVLSRIDLDLRQPPLSRSARRSPRAGRSSTVTDKAFDDRGRLVCTAVEDEPGGVRPDAGRLRATTQGSQGPDRIILNVYDIGRPGHPGMARLRHTANGFPRPPAGPCRLQLQRQRQAHQRHRRQRQPRRNDLGRPRPPAPLDLPLAHRAGPGQRRRL